MGNCLKINSDDISLLRGGSSASSTNNSRGASISLANDSSAAQDFNTDAPISAPPIYAELMQPIFYASMPTDRNNTSSLIQTYATTTAATNRQQHQLNEDEQVRLAKRIGLIQHLPIGIYDGGTMKGTNSRECVICMIDFCINEPVRYLPCMHAYHVRCIDDWLMRSLTCPSCMVPVDAALLISFETS